MYIYCLKVAAVLRIFLRCSVKTKKSCKTLIDIDKYFSRHLKLWKPLTTNLFKLVEHDQRWCSVDLTIKSYPSPYFPKEMLQKML